MAKVTGISYYCSPIFRECNTGNFSRVASKVGNIGTFLQVPDLYVTTHTTRCHGDKINKPQENFRTCQLIQSQISSRRDETEYM